MGCGCREKTLASVARDLEAARTRRDPTLSDGQLDALSTVAQAGGHGFGERAYLRRPTVLLLARRGLVQLGTRRRLPWAVITPEGLRALEAKGLRAPRQVEVHDFVPWSQIPKRDLESARGPSRSMRDPASLSAADVERLPAGTIVEIRGDFLVVVPDGMIPLFLLPKRSGSHVAPGEPARQWGDAGFALVYEGRGKLTTYDTGARKAEEFLRAKRGRDPTRARMPQALAHHIAREMQTRGYLSPRDLMRDYGVSLEQAEAIFNLQARAWGPGGKGEAWAMRQIERILGATPRSERRGTR